MKTKLLFAAGVLITTITTAQNQMLNSVEVTLPVFVENVSNSIDEFLQKNAEYPTESYLAGLEGTEVVKFVVLKDGKLSDFSVVNSVSPEIDNEVIRLLSFTNLKWLPGTKNGIPVEMETEVSLAFKVKQTSDFVEMAKRNMKKGNELLFVKNQPKRALKYFDSAINFLPYNETILGIRGLCKYRIGDEKGADSDWSRANILAEKQGNIIDYKSLAMKTVNWKDLESSVSYVKK